MNPKNPGATKTGHPSDMELVALISSKICHDVINPVGAIQNGIEIFDDDDGADAKDYAMNMIRDVTRQASARLMFARFAYGAAGSAGSMIDLSTARDLSLGYLGNGKHKLVWNGPPGHLSKDKVKLLLNLLLAGVSALPRGGEITVTIDQPLERGTFDVRCKGTSARVPPFLAEFLAGPPSVSLDTQSIQPYYATRLASTAGMTIDIGKDGTDIVLTAR
ncbi:MAG: histidine phosphotransferase family protein [Hyphomicrobiaceae bacterium]